MFLHIKKHILTSQPNHLAKQNHFSCLGRWTPKDPVCFDILTKAHYKHFMLTWPFTENISSPPKKKIPCLKDINLNVEIKGQSCFALK